MKVILNKEERLERSKTLTNYFIEKIDKTKSYEDIKAIFNEFSTNKKLNCKDKASLYKKHNEKADSIRQKIRNEHNNYKIAYDSFYKGLGEKTTNLEKLDYITNYKKVFKGLKNIDSIKKKEFYETLERLENNIKLNLEEEKFLEKSKTLTKDFIEKLNKIHKDSSYIKVMNIEKEIVSKLQDLTFKDFGTLINKLEKKANLIINSI